MTSAPHSHWKNRASGVVPQFEYQGQTESEVLGVQAAGSEWRGYKTIRLPKVCMDCGSTRPREGFAPVFNGRGLDLAGETLVLVCNPCYDRRCAQEEARERAAAAEPLQAWQEADQHRRQQNREACQRYREKLKQEQRQQERKAG